MNAPVNYALQGRTAVITLNRPEKRNALNDEMVEQLTLAFEQAEFDEAVRAVVLHHVGEVFCSGADLAHLQKLQHYDFDENKVDSRRLKEMFVRIFTMSKPVIAAVEGNAYAGGAGLLAVCDYVYCHSDCQFTFTEVKIGFIPAIVSYFAIKKAGKGRAAEWLISGRAITADEAKASGYISDIVHKEAVYSSALEFANKLAQTCSGEAIKQTKQLIQTLFYSDLDEAMETVVEANALARESADCKRGIAAFLNKEKLTW